MEWNRVQRWSGIERGVCVGRGGGEKERGVCVGRGEEVRKREGCVLEGGRG